MANRNLFIKMGKIFHEKHKEEKFDKYENEKINKSFEVLYEADKCILTVDKKKKYKESLDIWSHNIDSKIELIKLFPNSYEIIEEYERLIEENNEKKISFFSKEERKINEEQIKKVLILLALEYDNNKLYSKSKELFEKLFEDDSLKDKVKYYLFATYVKSFDYEKSKKFIYENEDFKEDVRILMPYLILNLLIGKEDEAKDILKRIKELNAYIFEAFRDDEWNFDFINNSLNSEIIEKGSINEVGISISYILPLVFDNSYVYNWIKKELKEESTKKELNVDSVKKDKTKKEIDNNKNQDKDKKKVNPLDSIMGQAITVLEENGYKTFESFLSVSEDDLLNIKYIGEKTIEQLKKNGVKFKK